MAHARLRPPELDDADWVRTQYALGQMTTRDIAEQLGCDHTTVARALDRHDIPPRPRGRSRAPELDDPTWLRVQYVDRARPQADIAAEVGCAPSAVSKALKRHGIQARPRSVPSFPRLGDEVWLREEYEVRQRSMAAIAAEVGCDGTTVAAALDRHGIPRRPPGRYGPVPQELDAAEWLRHEHHVNRRTVVDIAHGLGCSTHRVSAALRRHGVAVQVPIRRASRDIPKLRDVEWLRHQFIDQARLQSDIAADLGVGQPAVSKALKRHGITRGHG